MNQLITFVPEVMFVLFMGAVFVIVFVTLLRTLRATVFFQGTAGVIALCISVLCIVGLYQFLTVSWRREAEHGLGLTASCLLLPYVALVVAILLTHLLLFASRMLPSEGSEARPKRSESSPATDKPRAGRTKKEKSVQGQPKETTKTGESSS